MWYIYKWADCKLNVKATRTPLRSPRRMTGARDSRLLVPKACCRKCWHQSFLMDVSLFIFIVVYYLFNRMCISQLKVLRLGIRRLNLNSAKVSLGSVFIHMDNRFISYWQRRLIRIPGKMYLIKAGCFYVVITMFKSADVNIRPQPVVGTERIPINFVCWMWGCPFSWSITCLIEYISSAKGPENPKSPQRGKPQ